MFNKVHNLVVVRIGLVLVTLAGTLGVIPVRASTGITNMGGTALLDESPAGLARE